MNFLASLLSFVACICVFLCCAVAAVFAAVYILTVIPFCLLPEVELKINKIFAAKAKRLIKA